MIDFAKHCKNPPADVQPEHSPIGASSMYRWAKCPGSVKLSEGKTQTPSAYAEEGTEAHGLAAAWLKNGAEPLFPNPEMREAVKTYVDHVWSQDVKGCKLHVEVRFDLSAIYPGCFGTADAVIWNPKTGLLIVDDFKYGAGLYVIPEDNPQLKYYALGAMVTLGYTPTQVKMGIIQPRIEVIGGPIREIIISAVDLLDFSADLRQYAEATAKEDAPLIPGEWCRFCAAAPTCKALQAQTQAIAKVSFSKDLNYDPAKIKEALDMRPVVRAWLKNIDEFAYNEAEQGRCPPGYKLVEKRANRKWKDETVVTAALLPTFKNEIYAPLELRSPAQMEKLAGKKIIEPWVEKVSSGHALVPESDKRPAVNPDPKAVFQIEDQSA